MQIFMKTMALPKTLLHPPVKHRPICEELSSPDLERYSIYEKLWCSLFEKMK